MGFTDGADIVYPETIPESKWDAMERQYVEEIAKQFGKQHQRQSRYVGFCVGLLPTLNLKPEELKRQIVLALDLAEHYSLPVFFHLDDEHFWWRSPELWRNADMVEWSDFPKPGAKQGPVPPRYWVNWGEPPSVWPAPFPCFASPAFKAAIAKRLKECVAAPIAQRLSQWRKSGKDYLFAGVASGNETRVPDFTHAYEGYVSKPGGPEGLERGHVPPIKVRMTQEEMVPLGYHSLHYMGYNQQSIERLARQRGESVNKVVQDLFYDVAHDYVEFQAKVLYQAGVPKDRIYSHFTSTTRTTWRGNEEKPDPSGRAGSRNQPPPFWCAVNPCSRPGFTVVRGAVDLDVVVAQLSKAHAPDGGKAWAAVESYACTLQPGKPQTQAQYEEYLGGLQSRGAKVVNIYGWNPPGGGPFSIQNSGVIPALQRWLGGAQLSSAWHRSEEHAALVAQLQAKLAKVEETARLVVSQGHDPRLVQSTVNSFQRQADALIQAGKINEAMTLMDRTVARLQSMTR